MLRSDDEVDFKTTCLDGSSRARCGELSLPSGTVKTPAFMPVGTRGSVRGVMPDRLRECGTQMILANAYHLFLSPGAELVAELGGLHRFMGWDGPILTDSGGYQVFSLSEPGRVTDDGAEIRSPLDGSPVLMGPHEATRVQNLLGADIAMAFDQCPPYPCSRDEAKSATERTLKWAAVCKEVHSNERQALFGIVQGSVFEDLRARCAERIVGMEFDGYAIGGVSVGEEAPLLRKVVRFTAPLLPDDRPRYLMGVGFPPELLMAVKEGIDLFDCVAPTRMGRNATAFTGRGRLRLRNSAHRKDGRPIEEGCDCPACGLYSRAYLNHLFRCHEMLGPVLVSLHNLRFYHRMMAAVREAIAAGGLAGFCEAFLSRYLQGEDKLR